MTQETPSEPETIHLICGATGAGKSTYAEALARRIGGVRFSIDEWMARLHNPDRVGDLQFAWFYERVQRNCAQMRALAEQLARIGVASVFDCGLTDSRERRHFTLWAEAQGYTLRLHLLDLPSAVRWRRVEKRNAERAETYQFEVTRQMFDFIDSLWERPDRAELDAYPHSVITR